MPAALPAPPRGELFDEEVVYCLFVQNAPVYGLFQAPLSRKDFPRPGEDVTAGDKKGNLARKRLRGSLLIPYGHAAGVGVQTFALGKVCNAGRNGFQRVPGVVDEAGLLDKVVHAQGA